MTTSPVHRNIRQQTQFGWLWWRMNCVISAAGINDNCNLGNIVATSLLEEYKYQGLSTVRHLSKFLSSHPSFLWKRSPATKCRWTFSAAIFTWTTGCVAQGHEACSEPGQTLIRISCAWKEEINSTQPRLCCTPSPRHSASVIVCVFGIMLGSRDLKVSPIECNILGEFLGNDHVAILVEVIVVLVTVVNLLPWHFSDLKTTFWNCMICTPGLNVILVNVLKIWWTRISRNGVQHELSSVWTIKSDTIVKTTNIYISCLNRLRSMKCLQVKAVLQLLVPF